MLDLLLLIALAIPLWYAYRQSIAQGLVEINHVSLFTFGFLFYWISPVIIGIYGSHLAMQVWNSYFRLFDRRLMEPYVTSCIGLYLCFVAGDLLGRHLFQQQTSHSRKVPRLALSLMTTVGVIVAVSTWLALRNELIPYGPQVIMSTARGTLTSTARGTLTSCVALLGVVALLYMIDRPQMSWRARVLNRYFIPFALGCLVLLRLGSRLYVASFALMLVVYHTNFHRRLKLRTAVAGAVGSALLLGVIAVWRMQETVLDHPAYLLTTFVAEPVLISLSLVHYLRFTGIALINYPIYLISDFTNLIPALILPDKALLRVRAPIYMPMGGVNSFVSFNMNFGILGTAVVLFLLAISLRYLKSRTTETLFATIYIMCTACMAFTLFRDPFYVSIVKIIVQDAILMPAAIVVFGRILYGACLSSHAAPELQTGFDSTS